MQIKSHKNKKVIIIIFLFFLLIIMGLLKFNFDPQVYNDAKSVNISSQDSAEQSNYYKVYDNPYVIYLRKSFNAYLNNDINSVSISTTAIEKNIKDGIINGLDSFDKSYYKSKFVVITINDSLAGGKDIQIIFQDKPDRIFYAWVYQLSDGNYELRGFNSKENIDKNEMDKIIETYRSYIFDGNHSL